MKTRFLPYCISFVALTLLASAIPAFADQVSEWMKGLQSSSVAVRADSVEALAKEAQAKGGKVRCRPAFKPLMHTLGDPVESVRKQALRALASIEDRGDVPVLIGLLSDKNANRRSGAATLLGILG